MTRTYFDGWFSGYKASAEDWYTGGLVYVNIQRIAPGGRLSDPEWEKSFLLDIDKKGEIKFYADSLVAALASMPEMRSESGQLVPIACTLPKPAIGGVENA